MFTRLKRIILTVAAALALTAPVAVPAVVSAQNITGGLNCGVDVNIDASTNDCATATGTGATFSSLVKRVINIFSVIVGIIAVIMIIIGGLKYVTSGGDSGNVSTAKNTIIYALVGLVIVAIAQFIVHFVLETTNTAVSGQ